MHESWDYWTLTVKIINRSSTGDVLHECSIWIRYVKEFTQMKLGIALDSFHLDELQHQSNTVCWVGIHYFLCSLPWNTKYYNNKLISMLKNNYSMEYRCKSITQERHRTTSRTRSNEWKTREAVNTSYCLCFAVELKVWRFNSTFISIHWYHKTPWHWD